MSEVERPAGNRRLVAAAARPPRGEAGVATLALVLVMPAVVLLVSTVTQFVVYYHASHVATAAAHEALRSAQLADGTEDGARAEGEDFIAQAGPRLVLAPYVSVTRDKTAQLARVEIRARAPQLVFWLPAAITASAGGPLERFEPAR